MDAFVRGKIIFIYVVNKTIVLYCTVLYCTVLYCTVLYSTVQYSTVQYIHFAQHHRCFTLHLHVQHANHFLSFCDTPPTCAFSENY